MACRLRLRLSDSKLLTQAGCRRRSRLQITRSSSRKTWFSTCTNPTRESAEDLCRYDPSATQATTLTVDILLVALATISSKDLLPCGYLHHLHAWSIACVYLDTWRELKVRNSESTSSQARQLDCMPHGPFSIRLKSLQVHVESQKSTYLTSRRQETHLQAQLNTAEVNLRKKRMSQSQFIP